MGSSSAIKDSDRLSVREFRMPWVLRIAFAAGIVISVCMIIHSSDRQLRAMEESFKLEEKARMTLAGERDVMARVVARSAAETKELSGEIEVIAGSKRAIEQQFKESGKWLDDERRIRSGLQDEVARLSVQMTAFQKREGALQDIIELLEGEVASVEKRLKKIKTEEAAPQVTPNISGGPEIFASAGPDILRKNGYRGNNKGSHDAQVIALLNEIGTMNGEIEEVREERNILKAELDRLATDTDSNVAARRSSKQSKGRFSGFGKGHN